MLVIFDWDGTLCDSTGRIVEAMQQAARTCDIPVPSPAAVRNVIGLGLPEALAELFPGQTPLQRETVRASYTEHFLTLDKVPSGLFPDAMKVMESLRERGHALAVATGKGRAGLDRILGGLNLGDHFDATRCADETRSKPHPQMVHELLAELATPAAEAVVIGDSEYDLQMAAAAGVASIGVSWGVHDVERLSRQRPLEVVHRFADLLECRVLSQ